MSVTCEQLDYSQRARDIRILALDVDGILTTGALLFDHLGNEYKSFHSRDGVGIKLLQQNSIEVVLITGRRSSIVDRRADELAITSVYQGVTDKVEVAQTLLHARGLAWHQLAYMGDDLPDLALLRRAGLAFTVPEAPLEIRAVAHWITSVGGGMGAVRDVASWLLETRGDWQEILDQWGG
ncbi:MAG: HAD hydrolase family protein [Betaproteobacteria bacterium]|nr:HAD hydrolase family protein [Betaproteobacteria bacterium]